MKATHTVELVNRSYRIMSDNESYLETLPEIIRAWSRKIDKTVEFSFITESTYEKVCDLTMNPEQGGQLNNGLAVAFSSGFGDGVYDVYATYKDMGVWGERITKVEIELIEEDDEE
jgi:hypothetical protein